MVLPPPPAHASPVEPSWFDRLVVAIELSARGVLTLVDHAVPARLREAYLRLRARDPATEVIVDVRRLEELPIGATAILALEPPLKDGDLDWLNLNRPVLAERSLNVVLWCEDGAAAALGQRAPDFFDWISARVDCPPAPAAHAVVEVRRAICARAPGIAWDGPRLEETLVAVRPGRPVRRVKVASYQSMIEALTSREPGWLYLEGIDAAFHLRRLRWAMAETGRRTIVLRRALERTLPGWWTIGAVEVSTARAVQVLMGAGGTGGLAALAGPDPFAIGCAVVALRQGTQAARMEEGLAISSDPRSTLRDLVQESGWKMVGKFFEPHPRRMRALQLLFEQEAMRGQRDEDRIVSVLRGQPSAPEPWTELGVAALEAGDYEVAIRWLTTALRSLHDDVSSLRVASLLVHRGRAHHYAGDIVSARADLERAHAIASDAGDASMIVRSAAWLGNLLLEQGELRTARERLESALPTSEAVGAQEDVAVLLDMLAMALVMQGDLPGARLHAERALAIKRRVFGTEEHRSIMVSLGALGGILAGQGDFEGARAHLERTLEIYERLGEQDHPLSVSTLHALAQVHWEMRDLKMARVRLERALSIQRAALGSDDHPAIASTLIKLAGVLAASGNLEYAQSILEYALATLQKLLGEDGRRSGAIARRELANVLVAKGDVTGAIAHLERALVTLRKVHERDDHPDVAATLRELERLQQLQRELLRTD